MYENSSYMTRLFQEMNKLSNSQGMYSFIKLFIIANILIKESSDKPDILLLTMLVERSCIFTYLLDTVKLCPEKLLANIPSLRFKGKKHTYEWRPCEGKRQEVLLAMNDSLQRVGCFESYLGEIYRAGGLYDPFALWKLVFEMTQFSTWEFSVTNYAHLACNDVLITGCKTNDGFPWLLNVLKACCDLSIIKHVAMFSETNQSFIILYLSTYF